MGFLLTDWFDRPAYRGRSSSYHCLDQINFAISHPEHMKIGEAAPKKNIRDDNPLININQKAPGPVVGDYQSLWRAVSCGHFLPLKHTALRARIELCYAASVEYNRKIRDAKIAVNEEFR